jgi:PPM family protein phosphatase
VSGQHGAPPVGEATLPTHNAYCPHAHDDAVAADEFSGSALGLAADGMGGASGKGACDQALEVLKRELRDKLRHAATPEENRAVIRGALVAANENLLAVTRRDPDLRNVGTTVVLALWRQGNGIYIAGIGDSRAYLVRGDTIEQLTVDHTLARALVEAKTITAEEARTHRFRNVLWKYLGTTEVGSNPDVKYLPVRPRDRVLLCTDGLHGVVPDDRIVGCMRQHADVQKCAEALCQLALDSGSRDNVSCVVLEVPDDR